MKPLWLVALGPALAVLALGPPADAAEEKGAGPGFAIAGPLTFSLDEVPAFSDGEGASDLRWVLQIRPVQCSRSPSDRVKAYPKLTSKRPLYGSVRFDANPRERSSGIEFHFVLDESSPQAAKPAAKDAKIEPPPAKTKPAGEASQGQKTPPGSAAKGRAAKARSRPPQGECPYDRLYFDSNGDSDLTNDGVLQLAKEPAFPTMPRGSGGRFGELNVTFDFGPALGKRPFPVLVSVYSQRDLASVGFVAKTIRKGKIALGGEEHSAVLSQPTISGRYDRPFTQLIVMPSDASKPAPLLPSGPLGQSRWIGEQLVSVSASPLGDKLTIEPYRGDTGVLELGAGGRAITQMGFAAYLMSAAGTAPLSRASPDADFLPRRYTLPVGDYRLSNIVAQYGRLRFSGRLGADAATATKPPAFPVQIRKDKRQVLEFSGKAEVKFMAPAKEKTFNPGDAVMIKAMLDEPWQNVQITGLWDATKKQQVKYRIGGREVVRTEFAKIVPTITIKDSAGKTRAEGPMPFG